MRRTPVCESGRQVWQRVRDKDTAHRRRMDATRVCEWDTIGAAGFHADRKSRR